MQRALFLSRPLLRAGLRRSLSATTAAPTAQAQGALQPAAEAAAPATAAATAAAAAATSAAAAAAAPAAVITTQSSSLWHKLLAFSAGLAVGGAYYVATMQDAWRSDDALERSVLALRRETVRPCPLPPLAPSAAPCSPLCPHCAYLRPLCPSHTTPSSAPD